MADRRRTDEETVQGLREEGYTVVKGGAVHGVSRPRPAAVGTLWLLTSGSTGRPKRVRYTFDDLITVRAPQPPHRWLMAYSPGTYAWWQVMTLALTQPGQDVVALDPHERDRWPEIASREGVTAVSGTPTFLWRAVLHGWETLRRLPLKQISMGGEPVSQSLLDRLAEACPQARILWAYGSTETGLPVIVKDGRAGIPSSWLDRRAPGRRALRITGGELLLESAPGSGDFVGTGDRAEVVGDRVMILGRVHGDEINVGGSKVAASAVRKVLLDHESVVWARVSGRRVPVMGHGVVAEVVVREPLPEAELRQWCRERLPDYGVPMRISFREEIPETVSGKSDG
ncbi:AMP-binding protein [Streptomyces niveiscabiei]|uniref:AMP-binding protein n=1 Tax=Streptomyces niveiscabiei TaxID=164115 RepID=A0ABW9I8B3_9ACTN